VLQFDTLASALAPGAHPQEGEGEDDDEPPVCITPVTGAQLFYVLFPFSCLYFIIFFPYYFFILFLF
jgi:hypothetical protein